MIGKNHGNYQHAEIDVVLPALDDGFAQLYARYVESVVTPTEIAVGRVFDEWKEDRYWAQYVEDDGVAIPTPVQRTKTRIKRPESLRDKFRRLEDAFPDGPTEETLPLIRDLFGARVIVYFPAHLRLIDEELRSNRHFELASEYRPRSYLPASVLERVGMDPAAFVMKGRKPSGYSSLHYFVRLRSNPTAAANPWFELQTRTMLEEVWGEIEHQLGYKLHQRVEYNVARQFQVISSQLSAVDDHFDYLYDRLVYLQGKANPKPEDVLNVENLPAVLESVECLCEQDEIDGLLSILDSHGLESVEDFTSRARPEIVDAIRIAYGKASHGKKPTAFHIVSTVALLSPRSTPTEAERVLNGNLRMVELTRRTRQRSRGGQAPL